MSSNIEFKAALGWEMISYPHILMDNIYHTYIQLPKQILYAVKYPKSRSMSGYMKISSLPNGFMST